MEHGMTLILKVTLGISSVIFLILWIHGQKKLYESSKSLEYFKKLCEELDQNTKIIVKQDLELTRTHESLDKRARGLFALHELGNKMGSVFDESVMAEIVTKALIEEFDFEKSAFFMRPREKLPLLCLRSYGMQGKETLEKIIPDIEQLLQNNHGSILGFTNATQPNIHKIAADLKLDSFLLTPIEIKGRNVGLILAGNSLSHEKIGEDETNLLSLLADQAAVVIDNTKLYEQLRQSHHLLEAKVQERTRELEKMNDQLKHLSDMKSDFVSSASHELRTPLTSIKGYSSILISGKLGPVSQEQQERLEKIHHHSDELVEMINTLLDISRIERGKTEMKLETFSLKDLILKVIDLLQPQYMARKIQSKVEIPEEMEPISGDVAHLQRVLINLLSNALKYTPDDGSGVITVKVNPAEKEYKIAVSYNGVGIPQEALPKLFTEFYRVDAPMNQEIKGTGLGLSLVKKIVEAHTGAIWVESCVGEGTTFYFTLPRVK
jgi:signal transduction histidine kinase